MYTIPVQHIRVHAHASTYLSSDAAWCRAFKSTCFNPCIALTLITHYSAFHTLHNLHSTLCTPHVALCNPLLRYAGDGATGIYPGAEDSLPPLYSPLLDFESNALYAVDAAKLAGNTTRRQRRRQRRRRRRRRSSEGVGDVDALPPVRDAVVIRVEFKDYGVSTCDEACAGDIMWGTDGSKEHISGLYTEASYGAETIPKPATGQGVYTVQINKKLTKYPGCPYVDFAAAADQAMKKQHFIKVDDHAHFQIYLLPEETSMVGCKWDGLAYIGCDPDPAVKSPCKSFLRTNPMDPDSGARQALAHEIGHNLGLHHASTDADDDSNVESEYGDEAGIMGISTYWRSMNTPHRIELGWVSADAIQELPFPSSDECKSGAYSARPQDYRLASLHYAPSGISDKKSTLKIPRSLAKGGGFYYLGYRASVGYDSSLPGDFGDRVHLHYQHGDVDNVRTACLPACLCGGGGGAEI